MDKTLLFGKDETKRIVSIEPSDDYVEVFTEDDQGEVSSNFANNKYWLLSDRKVDRDWIRLHGNLHYKYGRQYTQLDTYNKAAFYLKKRYDIFTVYDFKEMHMLNYGRTYFKGMKHDEVSILSFDLETTQLILNNDAKVLLISNTFRRNGKITKKLFAYDEYDSEGEMIEAWCRWVREVNPSIICGHNINSFDFPFLEYCASRAGVQLLLGRNDSPAVFGKKDSKYRKEASQYLHYKRIKIYGREVIDTLFLSIKYDVVVRKYESYGLKNIIKQEGLEKPGRVFYDAAQIRFNYKIPEEWVKIKAYCIDDSDDALALYDLMIPAYFYFTPHIPKSFQSIMESSTGSPLNSFLVRSYLQQKHSVPKATELIGHVKGGISFGVPGLYKNVLKLDLKSAYPSQILRFKLFDEEKDPQGNFYKMVHHFTYERFELKDKYKETKDKYYYNREQAGKIVINSAYGMLNTNGLNFNNPKLASKITEETRNMIEFSIKWATDKDLNHWKEIGGYLEETEVNLEPA